MRIALDGREFISGRSTGIARVLSGLLNALAGDSTFEEITLAVYSRPAVPISIKENNRVTLKQVPGSFLMSEKALSDITKSGIHCFISPYPKLPLFGTHCPSIHTVHDVLDLTHAAYRKRLKVYLDKFRLKSTLAAANLTWYDSSFSRQETEKLIGFSGYHPQIRHLGIDDQFCPKKAAKDVAALAAYQLTSGYIVTVGNGLPHKNLQILLDNSVLFKRRLVFVGVSQKYQAYWKSRCPEADAIWLEHVQEADLPAILRNAFCLAQPSTAEGYGYPPLEAMACGVPAVISDIPVLRETTGGSAIAADPHNPDEWREAFSRMEKKPFYQSQVEKGLKWVEPLRGPRGWEKHVEDIKEIIGGDR